MKFKLTIKKSDSLVKSSELVWRVKEEDASTEYKDSGKASTDENGILIFESEKVVGGNYILIESGDSKSQFKIIVVKPEVSRAVTLEESKIEKPKVEDTIYGEIVSKYDISKNNLTDWDWIIWETEGNSDPKYQRGGKTRNLGLYKLNYDKLRRAGEEDWQPVFEEKESLKGGGWIKIAVLESEDYSKHKQLINMFLPCFEIEGGKIKEPAEFTSVPSSVGLGRMVKTANKFDTVDANPPVIVLPFNYDDNGDGSRAVGKDLSQAVFGKVEAKRLKTELTRWATASRSTITAFPKEIFPSEISPNGLGIWKIKDLSSEEVTTSNKWDLRPTSSKEWKNQITGPSDGVSLRTFQLNKANDGVKFYSVKTGVQYVSTQNQISTSKDLLEENSIHAMNRSNLINATLKRLPGKFEAAYQIEILSILILKDPDSMKIVKEKPKLLKNKALEDPAYQYREKLTDSLRESLENIRREFNETNKKETKEKITKLLSSKILVNFETEEEVFDIPEELKLFEAADNVKVFNERAENLIERIKKINSEKAVSLNSSYRSLGKEFEVNKPRFIEKVREILNSKAFEGDFTKEILAIEQAANNADEYEENIELLIDKIGKTNQLQLGYDEEFIKTIKAKLGFDGVQVREISNAGANDIWFPALAIPCHGKAFAKSWGGTDDWITFWKDNFAVPLGRAKGEMLAYFGMQHMTSNSQNFIVSFDRTVGGSGGKIKNLILRDIGDTLYNNYFFDVLKDLDKLYKKEWEHESGDKEFGVTLSSALGSYTMPRMTRIGATIVFFFGPFIQGDILESPDCYKILVNWCLAHNRAFLDYMKEKIGYTENWGGRGKDVPSPNFENALSKRCNLNKANEVMYQNVVREVLELSSRTRLDLIKIYESRIGDFPDSELKDKKTTETAGINLVNAHEVLICAEIQRYIQSDMGKEALRNLHREESPSRTSKTEPKLTLEKYSKLHTGMPYEEVVRLLGSEGIDITPQSGPSDVTVFRWKDEEREIIVIFNYDSVHNINQKNLR